MYHTLLDALPLWGLFLATIVLSMLFVEIGYQLGKVRRKISEFEKESSVGTTVGATLGLLAFMLAFTFGMAASRFDARRMVVLEESNAIGTSYLRAGLLPEPSRSTIRNLYREYVNIRLDAKPSELDQVIAKSTELQNKMWSLAEAEAAKDPHAVLTGLFIQSLNDVIDVHSKRVLIGLRSRIPGIIWAALYIVAFLSMGALGYQEGVAGARRSLAVWALAVAFSAVLWLNADLDRPQEGLLRVSQQSLRDLQESISPRDAKIEPTKP